MIEYYHGFKLTTQRGHIVVTDPSGDFYESADDMGEAITDIDAELTLDDMRDTTTVLHPIRR